MAHARIAVSADLERLLDLFAQAPVSDHARPIGVARDIWERTLSHPGVDVFVSVADSKIVATCMLITAPNLLREGRHHGFIENVVTHDDYLRRGHGTAVIQAALDAAWTRGCFHVMLQSGRKDPGVYRFYERQGFEGGLRVAYVARHRPAD